MRPVEQTNVIAIGGRSSGNALTGNGKKRAGGGSSAEKMTAGTSKKRLVVREGDYRHEHETGKERQTSDLLVIRLHCLELISRQS